MGLSVITQDAQLNWFRGRPYPGPVDMLWLSYHAEPNATGLNEVSLVFGGRVAVLPADFSEPVNGEGGLREISNLKAIISQNAQSDQLVGSVGLWDSQGGGTLLISAAFEPELQVAAGDPVVLLRGQLKLRATSSRR